MASITAMASVTIIISIAHGLTIGLIIMQGLTMAVHIAITAIIMFQVAWGYIIVGIIMCPRKNISTIPKRNMLYLSM